MTKDLFIETLKKSDITQSEKVECIRFFINNFPVNIPFSYQQLGNGMIMKSQGPGWTALDIDIKDLKWTPKMDEAINSLKLKIKELEKFSN